MSISQKIIETREKVLLEKNGHSDALIVFCGKIIAIPIFPLSLYLIIIIGNNPELHYLHNACR